MTNIYIEPLHSNSKIPEKQTTHAACYDVHAHLQLSNYTGHKEDPQLITISAYTPSNVPYYIDICKNDNLRIIPGNRVLVPTGLKACCNPGFKIQAVPRSGLSFKQGLALSNSVGTIDADYRKELFIILTNTSDSVVTINHDDRIAQIELIRLTPTTLMIGKLPSTDSNRTGGIGHTGT